MIEAWPRGLISTGYRIFEDGRRLGSLDYPLITFAYRARLTIGDEAYEASARWERKGFISVGTEHSFSLQGKAGVVVRSESMAGLTRRHRIFHDAHEYVLAQGASLDLFDVLFTAEFPLLRGEEHLGTIKARGPLCRSFQVGLPSEVPLLARLFALYLATVMASYSPLRLRVCLRPGYP